ncbi:hypothetical protein V8B97DRAFT_1939546 [Scleroderma yunnanense]
MSSWYSSLFSGFPTFDFAVPATIQRRFFSFIFKKTLGRFLKPGQFDLHQIDLQLGSGAVHVTDLELDGQAINEMLVGLPFRLHDGFIAGVTARVPFPNPITSSVGLHVRSLQLTFHAEQHESSPTSPLFSTAGLADSVTSVAETFVHRELTPKEEAAFLESLHPTTAHNAQADESEYLPGGFDPFVRSLDDDTETKTHTTHANNDPAGVSVFATFIERLLARFEFSALNTKVTIVHPGSSSFTFSIPEIQYHTQSGTAQHRQPPSMTDEHEDRDSRAQVRSVVISGFSVTSRNLRQLVDSPTNTAGTLSPISDASHPLNTDCGPLTNVLSRSSSSSSLDEDTQILMSQSIAMLPPRPPSPASSVSSSMYQSVLSMVDGVTSGNIPSPSQLTVAPITIDAERRAPSSPRISTLRSITIAQESNDDVVLSFGSQPITIQLYIPPPDAKRTGQTRQADKALPEPLASSPPGMEVLQLSISTGTLACALRACHVRMLLDLIVICTPKAQRSPPVPHQRRSPSPHFAALGLRASVNIRGVVMTLISEPPEGQSLSLSPYFEHPFVPPRLCCPYVRLLLDDITGHLSLVPPPSPRSPISPDKFIPASAEAVLSDMSLLVFHAVSAAEDPQVAAPIIITDWYLPTLDRASHYRPSFSSENPSYVHLPIFDVIDWTQAKYKGNSTRLSTWRTKPRSKSEKLRSPAQRPRGLSSSPNPFIVSPSSDEAEKLLPPAISVNGCFSPETSSLHIKVAPLHFFLDLGMTLNGNVLLKSIEEVMSSISFVSKSRKGDLGEEDDPVSQDPDESRSNELKEHVHSRSMSAQTREREIERRRLEKLVLDDLNLGMVYDVDSREVKNSKAFVRQQAHPRRRKTSSGQNLNISLSCSVIRVEVRCIPPPGRLPRSGSLLINIYDLLAFNDPTLKKPPLRFFEGPRTAPQIAIDHGPRVGICVVQLSGVLIAYAPAAEAQAQTLCVLGCMPDTDASTLFATETNSSPLPVRLTLGKMSLSNQHRRTSSNRFSLTMDVPLINLVIEKRSFDGLQYWTDDVAQLLERSMSGTNNVTEALPSRNPSLIGSRFFMRPSNSGSRSSEGSTLDSPVHKPQVDNSETAVKVNVTEALFRVLLPRDEHDPRSARPFDIHASDVDVLVELKPDGKDETVITAGIMDLRVADTSRTGFYMPLVVLTAPRTLSAAPKPMIKIRVTSLVVAETTIKESKIKLSLWGTTCHVPPDLHFVANLASFAKAPPGVFESVVPSERTVFSVAVNDVSVQLKAPEYPGASVLHIGEADFSTELIGNSLEFGFKLSISALHFLIIDSIHDTSEVLESSQRLAGVGIALWKNSGYALVADVANCHLSFRSDNSVLPPETSMIINHIELGIHLCADTLPALTGFISHLTPNAKDNNIDETSDPMTRIPSTITIENDKRMIASLDENAFRRIPEVGSAADMVSDDLPANLDYLDASFGAAAGLRELRDEDLEDFDSEEESGRTTPVPGETGVISNVGGETIRVFRKFSFTEHYFDTVTPDMAGGTSHGETTLRVRVHDADVTLFLHDGYDWPRTRKIIEKEVKEMKKKLARIRQLVAMGQTQEPIEEETSAMLFNSIHIGLEQDLENMDTDTLIAAIDHELDEVVETGSQSSWQSLHPASPGQPRVAPTTKVHGKRLTRSRGPSIEIRLSGLNAEVDNYRPGETLVSRTLILVKDLEILDHIKTSTWKKFLTALWSDSRGNIRETDSNMTRVELLIVRPSPYHSAEEARLRAKFLPLRLYVDQDALDFFKKFFAFKDPDSPASPNDAESQGEIYFQHAEVFAVDIKLDYKPRRVDYRALREGRTIELMNFFHFDGAEMTLRHLTLHGITGWPRFFDTLNDLWTPDVKATQLVDVISGVAPIRSMVNVGSGVADLVLLPIAQYKKDGRIVRGVQKGTKAFVQSTAMEAIKLGARLATGTQVILEQTENVLGGQFNDSITAETLQTQPDDDPLEDEEDLISRYAMQPSGVAEGVQTAYRSLRKGLHSAAQTILAVPMEVYERSGNEGAVRAVIRAVPIAVLKPMIGASEAVSKTLMGLHNTLDPNVRHENEAKYKHR